jgi:two-component system, sensor histidine kinase and response regulator
VADVLEACVDVVWPLACTKGVLVTSSVPAALRRTTVRGDALRLRQILVHLLNNAVKFSERGTVEVLVSVEYLRPGSLSVRFEVRSVPQLRD